MASSVTSKGCGGPREGKQSEVDRSRCHLPCNFTEVLLVLTTTSKVRYSKRCGDRGRCRYTGRPTVPYLGKYGYIPGIRYLFYCVFGGGFLHNVNSVEFTLRKCPQRQNDVSPVGTRPFYGKDRCNRAETRTHIERTGSPSNVLWASA